MTERLPLIQILRAAAALAVCVHHAGYDAGRLAERAGTTFPLAGLFPWMSGVDVFFVISGFIMVYASADLFAAPGGRATFIAHRLARIVPLYWALTSAFLAVALLVPGALNSGAPSAGEIAASYLFWPVARADGAVQPVYSLGWTLNYEMFFYGLFALALGFRRDRAVTLVAAILVVLVAATAILRPPLPFAFWGQPIVLEFAAGMGIGVLRARGVGLAVPVRLALFAAGLAALALHGADGDGQLSGGVALRGGAAALIVAAAALNRRSSHAMRWPESLVALGDASYALYLAHPFAVRALAIALGGLPFGTATPAVMALAAIVLSCLLALAIHRLFEKPVTRLLRRAIGR